MQRYPGVYRGVVVDNSDPQKSGRLRVRVPAIAGAADSWALPCLPFAGAAAGLGQPPQIGRGVWVAFEGGDPASPVLLGFLP